MVDLAQTADTVRAVKMARAFGVWNLLKTSPDGVTLKALADRFEVSKNTIQRDLNQLSAAGVPIGERQHGQTLKYRLEAPSNPVSFGGGDLKALHAARAAIKPFKRSAMFKAFEAAVSKLEAQYQPSSLEAFEGPLWTGAKEPAGSVLETLLTGVLESRACRIQYLPGGKKQRKEFVIEPHKFLLWNGVTYLRACIKPYENMVPLVGYQISEAALLPEKFERKNTKRTGFGVFQNSEQHEVEVKFHAEVAPYIREKRWHPTQELEELPDGAVIFRAKLSGRDEFVGWVMSWSPGAEMMKPKEWRESLVERARGLVGVNG